MLHFVNSRRDLYIKAAPNVRPCGWNPETACVRTRAALSARTEEKVDSLEHEANLGEVTIGVLECQSNAPSTGLLAFISASRKTLLEVDRCCSELPLATKTASEVSQVLDSPYGCRTPPRRPKKMRFMGLPPCPVARRRPNALLQRRENWSCKDPKLLNLDSSKETSSMGKMEELPSIPELYLGKLLHQHPECTDKHVISTSGEDALPATTAFRVLPFSNEGTSVGGPEVLPGTPHPHKDGPLHHHDELHRDAVSTQFENGVTDVISILAEDAANEGTSVGGPEVLLGTPHPCRGGPLHQHDTLQNDDVSTPILPKDTPFSKKESRHQESSVMKAELFPNRLESDKTNVVSQDKQLQKDKDAFSDVEAASIVDKNHKQLSLQEEPTSIKEKLLESNEVHQNPTTPTNCTPMREVVTFETKQNKHAIDDRRRMALKLLRKARKRPTWRLPWPPLALATDDEAKIVPSLKHSSPKLPCQSECSILASLGDVLCDKNESQEEAVTGTSSFMHNTDTVLSEAETLGVADAVYSSNLLTDLDATVPGISSSSESVAQDTLFGVTRDLTTCRQLLKRRRRDKGGASEEDVISFGTNIAHTFTRKVRPFCMLGLPNPESLELAKQMDVRFLHE